MPGKHDAQRPQTKVADVVQAIATDPLMASRILAVANSAAYAGGASVSGLHPAVMRLGMKFVQDMVCAESVRLKVFSGPSYRSTLEQSWRLSLGTAIACDALARSTGLEREGAFMLGLLHDIGVPVLISAVSGYAKQNNDQALREDVVEILMSQLHEEVGAYVLRNWGMSDAFVSAARTHHLYRGSAKSTPAQKLVYAGNQICEHLGIASERRDVNFQFVEIFSDLQLADTDKVSPILESVSEQFNSMVAGMLIA